MANSWFERFPLETPPVAEVAKEGTMEKALEVARSKKIKVSTTEDCLSMRSHLPYSNLRDTFPASGTAVPVAMQTWASTRIDPANARSSRSI